MQQEPTIERSWRKRLVASAVMLAVPVTVVGCGSDSASTATDSSSSVVEDVESTDSSATDTGATDSSATDTGATDSSAADSSSVDTTQVNANSASVSELAAAFEAAGVPNASKWAREVEEYRPYSDDNWQRLREELAKYNIDEATFALITSVLTLD